MAAETVMAAVTATATVTVIVKVTVSTNTYTQAYRNGYLLSNATVGITNPMYVMIC